MDRLFLDANVLFSAAYREDTPLRQLWHRPRTELITSAYALLEVERHLDEEQRGCLAELMQEVKLVADAPPGGLEGVALRDKDVPILAAAIAAKATHLITGDRRDFGAHYGETIGSVLIMRPRDYLAAAPRK